MVKTLNRDIANDFTIRPGSNGGDSVDSTAGFLPNTKQEKKDMKAQNYLEVNIGIMKNRV